MAKKLILIVLGSLAALAVFALLGFILFLFVLDSLFGEDDIARRFEQARLKSADYILPEGKFYYPPEAVESYVYGCLKVIIPFGLERNPWTGLSWPVLNTANVSFCISKKLSRTPPHWISFPECEAINPQLYDVHQNGE